MKIHVMRTGQIQVTNAIPFGGPDTTLIQASGIFARKKDKFYVPVTSYLIEHPKGLILFDTGWDRSMAPNGKRSIWAQAKSTDYSILGFTTHMRLPEGQSAAEQLAAKGIRPEDLTCIYLSHLDLDHVNGLQSLKAAPKKQCAAEEIVCAKKFDHTRYDLKWWKGCGLTTLSWNGTEGPFGESHDIFGDGSLVLIHLPGHSMGLMAMKITNLETGKYYILSADSAYMPRNWKQMILPGVGVDRAKQLKSLEWIRSCSQDPDCIRILATHDPAVNTQIIEV